MRFRLESKIPAARVAACAALLLPFAAGGCTEAGPDAYGTFEATEIAVAAESAGRLLSLSAEEGEVLVAESLVGQIDTAALGIQRREIASRQAAARARRLEAEAQIGVLDAQIVTAREEYERTNRLFRAEAATAQRLALAEGELRVLEARRRAARAQTVTADEDVAATAARLAQIDDEISRARVVNPTAGTVLVRFAEPGEFVQPGQPLYRIADLSVLTLRAYISGAQLSDVRLGQTARVSIDTSGGGLLELPGTVTWIASDAEFTPTPIQTRDERTAHVYAVRVRVANPDGRIKIGMPGDVVFEPIGAAAQAFGDAGSAWDR